jgi:copper(I)-binding protein
MNQRSAWPLVAVLVVVAAVVLGAGVVLTSGGGDDETTAGEAAATGVAAREAWTGPNQGATAVYLTIDNGGTEDRLVGASTETAETASLMGGDTDVGHTEGGAGAEPVSLTLPPGTTVLRPGGRHLMLQGVTGALQPGTSFPVRLEFEHAGPVDIEVEVVTWDEAASRLRSNYDQ